MSSEVAQLRQRIEDEITSMYLLMNGPAVVSKHTMITHKYRNLGAYHQELAKLVGEQPAERIVNETYYQIMEGDQNATTQSETDHQIITTTQDYPSNG